MIILAVLVSIAGIAALCWLLFTLAVFALPFFAAIAVGSWAYATGAGSGAERRTGLLASTAPMYGPEPPDPAILVISVGRIGQQHRTSRAGPDDESTLPWQPQDLDLDGSCSFRVPDDLRQLAQAFGEEPMRPRQPEETAGPPVFA